jgi:hypothetical protein
MGKARVPTAAPGLMEQMTFFGWLEASKSKLYRLGEPDTDRNAARDQVLFSVAMVSVAASNPPV